MLGGYLAGIKALQRAGHLVGGQADVGAGQGAQDDDMLGCELLRRRKPGCERHQKYAPDSNALHAISPFSLHRTGWKGMQIPPLLSYLEQRKIVPQFLCGCAFCTCNFTKCCGGGLRLTMGFFRRRVLLPREKIATAAALSQGAHSASPRR